MIMFTDTHVADALTAIQDGDDSALDAFYAEYSPVLETIAYKAPAPDREDALSMANVAFMETARSMKPDTPRVAAAFYRQVQRAVMADALEDRTVHVPDRSAKRYLSVMKAHGGDSRAAYAACAAGETGMEATAFLAAHVANYSHMDRESVDPSGTDSCDTRPAFQLPAEDAIGAVDNHDLVHNHLLPLCDDAQHEGIIVRMVYGFPDVGRDVASRMEAAGFQKGDPLSDIEASEVLALPGLGSRTLGKRRRAALDRMREHLSIDTANEEGH